MSIRFNVHVHPGSKAALVGGSYDGSLTVKVRSRAIEGAATKEVLVAIAHAFDVRTSAVRLVHATTSRTKLVEVDGDEQRLWTRLTELSGD